MKPITTDPHVLANIVSGLGGTVLAGPTFRFELPRENAKEVIPKINELGLRCRTVDERIKDHPTRLNSQQTVLTIALYNGEEDDRFHMPQW